MKYMFVLGAFVLATVAITEARSTNLGDEIESAVIRLRDMDETPYVVRLGANDSENAIVSITRVGDDEFRSAGFSVSEPTTVRVVAMGEGTGNTMHDYAWIVDADSRSQVWTMQYNETQNAGGARKNRVEDVNVTLQPGSYIVYYASDGSHSYGDWNSTPPTNRSLWGVTVIPNPGNTGVATFEPDTRNVISSIVRVGDSQNRRTTFELSETTPVLVYALGEGSGNEMYDYAAILDADTRNTVWRMDYGDTEWAGGAQKNRMEYENLTLPAGRYALQYRSDGSHSFGDWNSEPPSDQANWGVTVYAADSQR